eukprot:g9884.t1
MYPGCSKRSSYGFEGSKEAEFCAGHAVDCMVSLKRQRRCAHPDCTKQPSHGTEGSRKSEFCAGHAKVGMVNVSTKRCASPGCRKYPSFGMPGSGKKETCAEHAREGMVSVAHVKKCGSAGCGTRASFGPIGSKTAEFCAKHAKEGSVNIRAKRCTHPGCWTRASFGLDDGKKKAEFCVAHAEYGMANVCSKEPAVVFVPGQGDAAGGSRNGGVTAPGGAAGPGVIPGVPGPAAALADSRPFSEQVYSYPATCLLVVMFVTVFVVMSRRRVSAASMGSSYRHLLVRSEWWRVLTATVTHNGILHLGFNVASLWYCRGMEAELGSWPYLVASAHLMILAEVLEKMIMHVLLKTVRVTDVVSCGYSGVVFAWMVVLSLKPDAQSEVIGGLVFDGFAYVVFNLVVVRILIRGSSFMGNLAGVWAGLLFSTGGLDFARERFWGLGVGAWALAVFLGSLKATTTVPLPLLDYVDLSGRDDLGVSVVPLDWSNREWLEDWAVANA